MSPPALDHDLGFRQRVEHLAIEQLVAELTSLTPIARTASATGRPCAVGTSTCRSLLTISSAVCRFLAIFASSSWREAIPQGGPLLRFFVEFRGPASSVCALVEIGPAPQIKA
jgi:hypothetical protein